MAVPRLFLIDVAQHVEPAVDKAVADRGDDDVADAAVRHAGDLLLRNFAHWFSSSLAAALRSICASIAGAAHTVHNGRSNFQR